MLENSFQHFCRKPLSQTGSLCWSHSFEALLKWHFQTYLSCLSCLHECPSSVPSAPPGTPEQPCIIFCNLWGLGYRFRFDQRQPSHQVKSGVIHLQYLIIQKHNINQSLLLTLGIMITKQPSPPVTTTSRLIKYFETSILIIKFWTWEASVFQLNIQSENLSILVLLNGGLLWDVEAVKELSDILVLHRRRLLDQSCRLWHCLNRVALGGTSWTNKS